MVKESGSTTMERKWEQAQPRLHGHSQLEMVGLLWEDSTQTRTSAMQVFRLMN